MYLYMYACSYIQCTADIFLVCYNIYQLMQIILQSGFTFLLPKLQLSEGIDINTADQ